MPTIKERLVEEIKDAMRAKDEIRLNTLRAMKSAIKYKEVEPGAKELDDTTIIPVLVTMVKQRRDSVEQFRAGKRDDLADKEEKEIAVIQTYLPQQLSAADLTAEIA